MSLLERLRRRLRPTAAERSAFAPGVSVEAIERTAAEWPRPPSDWRDNAGWNAYWQRVIEHERWRASHIIGADSFVVCPYTIDWLDLGNPTRVLVAGNGISALPRMLERAGFAVKALDVSTAATEFARANGAPPEYWSTGPLVDSLDRPGGSVEYVCGDLFDHDVTPGPFDVIVSTNALHGFNDQDLEFAVRGLDARLRPGGLCKVLVWNSSERCQDIQRLFLSFGYALGTESNDATQKRLQCDLGTG